MKSNLLIILFSCLLASFSTDGNAPLSDPVHDDISLWQLVSIKGRTIQYADEQQPITLQINSESKTISGHAGCNNYFGNYLLGKPCSSKELPYLQHISISQIGSTKMVCPDNFMQLEQKYLPLLEKANRMQMTDDELILYQNNKEILRYDHLVR